MQEMHVFPVFNYRQFERSREQVLNDPVILFSTALELTVVFYFVANQFG